MMDTWAIRGGVCVRTFSSRASLFAMDRWSSGNDDQYGCCNNDAELLTWIVCLMAVLLSLMESIVLLLLLDL